MALREACSPSNITAASGLPEVLTKKDFEGVVEVVMRKVEAKPLPPWDAILVVDGSRARARTIAGSSEGGIFSELTWLPSSSDIVGAT